MESDVEMFEEYLSLRGIETNSRDRYVQYFRMFGDIRSFNQSSLNSFLMRTKNGNVVRAVCRHIKEFILENIEYFNIDKDIIDRIKFPKISGAKRDMLTHYITLEDLEKVIKDLFKTGNIQRNILMTKYQFFCGLRVSELVNIRFNDLMIEENMTWLDIITRIDEGKQIPFVKLDIIGKRIKERMVVVPPDIVALTAAWLVKNQHLIDKAWNPRIFNIGVRRWQAIIGRSGKRALGNTLHTHMLRHGFATWLFNDCGIDLLKVAQILGHKDISTTQRYTHINQDKLDNDIRNVHSKRLKAENESNNHGA